jgi:hypothetical protein
MALLFGGSKLWTKYNLSLASKRAQLLTAQEKVGTAKLELARGQVALRDLSEWQDVCKVTV